MRPLSIGLVRADSVVHDRVRVIRQQVISAAASQRQDVVRHLLRVGGVAVGLVDGFTVPRNVGIGVLVGVMGTEHMPEFMQDGVFEAGRVVIHGQAHGRQPERNVARIGAYG